MNYSILKDGVLRKKFRDLGIPDWGPRPLLQRRHTEWMNLWNANCDSKIPKSKAQLLRELDVWERTQGGRATSWSVVGSEKSAMHKNFDSASWSATHNDDFKQLTANARQRKEHIVRTMLPQASNTRESPEASSLKPEQNPEPATVPSSEQVGPLEPASNTQEPPEASSSSPEKIQEPVAAPSIVQ